MQRQNRSDGVCGSSTGTAGDTDASRRSACEGDVIRPSPETLFDAGKIGPRFWPHFHPSDERNRYVQCCRMISTLSFGRGIGIVERRDSSLRSGSIFSSLRSCVRLRRKSCSRASYDALGEGFSLRSDTFFSLRWAVAPLLIVASLGFVLAPPGETLSPRFARGLLRRLSVLPRSARRRSGRPSSSPRRSAPLLSSNSPPSPYRPPA